LESFKGQRDLPRPPRKRGGGASDAACLLSRSRCWW
jgi:hypothetical protein